jgi:hypothetical protein
MRNLQFLGLYLFLFFSCKKAPEYPIIPAIKFDKIRRFTIKNSFTQSLTDSICIDITFKDGDGDLGLSEQDTQYPYNAYNLIYDQDGNLIKIGTSDTLPFYNTCNYAIGYFSDPVTDKDTVLISQNPNYFNYFVEMWVSKNGNSYTKVDFIHHCPPPFNGRFLVLSPNNYRGPLDGKLTFTIADQPWIKDLYQGQKAIFKIYIQDRALHKSNMVETTPITFEY